jgi:hypothetical protein
MLPKGKTYSVTYGALMHETVALFELFYHAKDFETFYKTACWAREFINEEMFIYTFSVALIHRPDCKDFYIPPIYEIYPHYFFTTEVIERAYKAKMQGSGKHMEPHVHEGDHEDVYIQANYSSWYYSYNREQRLAYFTEDIAWNAFYYNYFLRFPYWMDGDKYQLRKEHRGELVFYMHRQIFARYYMERLSNDLGEISEISLERPIEIGYDPYLKYANGLHFPSRPNHFELKKYPFYLTLAQDYLRRVRDAVAQGFAVTVNDTPFVFPSIYFYTIQPEGRHVSLRKPENIEVLGELVEASVDSPDAEYYGFPQFLLRQLLGNSPRPSTE